MPKVENGPEELNVLLESTYADCMKNSDDIQQCSMIAWDAAKKAGWKLNDESGKWEKQSDMSMKCMQDKTETICMGCNKYADCMEEGKFALSVGDVHQPSAMGNDGESEDNPDEKEIEIKFSKELNFSEANMEIFSVGTWNGQKFTKEDLQKIVESYSEIGDKTKPYLKLGHNDEQQLAKKSGMGEDGKPALGWLHSLKLVGDNLVAHFKDVPKVLAELIQKGAYKRVSSEIYFNYDFKDKIYPFVLKAVALLGADTPAVTTLQDVVALYQENDKPFEVFNFTKDFKKEEVKMDELELKLAEQKAQLEADFAAKLDAQKVEFSESIKKSEDIVALFSDSKDVEAALVKFKQDQVEIEKKEKFYTEELAKSKKLEIETFVSNLLSSNKILPPQVNMAKEILFNLDNEAKTIKFTKSELYGLKEEMTLSETIRAFMSSIPDLGLLKQYSSTKEDGSFAGSKEEEAELLVSKYMDDKKVSYGDAQLEVSKIRPELFEI